MNLDKLLDKEEVDMLSEAKHTSCLEYERRWYEMSKKEAEKYNTAHGTHIHGYWVYDHREAAGCKYGDKRVVHHIDRDKHDNDPDNLQAVSRAEHCRIDPNALKHEGEKCKVKGCDEPYYAHGLCRHHYMIAWKKLHKKLDK